jgi:hypothetical protein
MVDVKIIPYTLVHSFNHAGVVIVGDRMVVRFTTTCAINAYHH